MSYLFVVLLTILAVIALLVALFALCVLFGPIVCNFDTTSGRVRARWLLLQYAGPLLWNKGGGHWLFAGKEIHPSRRKHDKKPREPRKRPKKSRGLFLARCLRDSSIRRAFRRQLVALGRGILRSASVTECRARVSLPDPAANGILYGALAAVGWTAREEFQLNFAGENNISLEIRIHLYCIVRPILSFLIHLPYRAAFRHWRAAATTA